MGTVEQRVSQRSTMLKFLIVLAFLSTTALGNLNPFDREWDEDAKAYCVEKCEDYCTNCTEPVRCGEGQRKCGEKPIDPTMSQCSPDDICVPAECECDYEDKNGDTCERLCTVECTEDQVKCGVKETATGCMQNDICIHKGFDNNYELCDGFCPVECEDTELLFQMTPFPTDAPNPKTAFLNKRITKEIYAHTNNAPSNAQKPDICAREMLMNTGAKKKMFAF